MLERVVLRWFRELIAIAIAAAMVGLTVWLIHSGLAAAQAASYSEQNFTGSPVSRSADR